MIAVDPSAVLAILLGEDRSGAIEAKMLDQQCVLSAASRVELGIVVEARNGPAGTQLLEELLDRVDMKIEPVGAEDASAAVVAWRRFGKGRHPASLNFGDTFSYAVANRLGVPLLFVGDDLSRTDITPA